MIRDATQTDMVFITTLAHTFDRFGPLYVQVFEKMLLGNQEALARWNVNGEITLLIHEDDRQQPTGFIAVEWDMAVGHIQGVAVDECSRRQGVATLLLDKVEQLAREQGVSSLDCITAETDNDSALRCFTKWGFDNNGYEGPYPRGQRAVKLIRQLDDNRE